MNINVAFVPSEYDIEVNIWSGGRVVPLLESYDWSDDDRDDKEVGENI